MALPDQVITRASPVWSSQVTPTGVTWGRPPGVTRVRVAMRRSARKASAAAPSSPGPDTAPTVAAADPAGCHPLGVAGGPAIDIPAAVRNRAAEAGAHTWLEGLPRLVGDLASEWGFTPGRPFTDGTEAYVAEVRLDDATPAVLKLAVPRKGLAGGREATVLALVGGDGCPELYRHDEERGALLMERLGPSLFEIGVAVDERDRILCDAASRLWRPAVGCGLPTGADKAVWLVDRIVAAWEALDRPCSERTVDHAVACARRRRAAHDDERAVLVHGDVHQWNALRSPRGWLLIDPDGLLAEPAYDLGVVLREDPVERADVDAVLRRSRGLAERGGLDAAAVWEWGVVERVSTGLIATGIDLQPVGRQMLALADRLALAGW